MTIFFGIYFANFYLNTEKIGRYTNPYEASKGLTAPTRPEIR
jgi:hypothetical protein